MLTRLLAFDKAYLTNVNLLIDVLCLFQHECLNYFLLRTGDRDGSNVVEGGEQFVLILIEEAHSGLKPELTRELLR